MTALEPFFLAEFLGTATWLWLVFISIVISLLVFDLGVLHREHREIVVDGQRIPHGDDLQLPGHPA